jgi:hypothetical protein
MPSLKVILHKLQATNCNKANRYITCLHNKRISLVALACHVSSSASKFTPSKLSSPSN